MFEREVEAIEDALLLTTIEKAVAWAQSNSVWPDTFGLACCAIEMMSIVSSRYDIARFGMERFSSSPRQADLLIVSGRVDAQDGRAAASGVRPDAGAEVGDRHGRVRELRRDVQQLHDPPGRRQDRSGRHPRARLPASPGGADGGHHPSAREDPRQASRRRTRSAGSQSDAHEHLRGRARASSRRASPSARRPSSSTPPGSSRRARSSATSTASTSSPTSPPPTTSAGESRRSRATSGPPAAETSTSPDRAGLRASPIRSRHASRSRTTCSASATSLRRSACRSGSTTASRSRA